MSRTATRRSDSLRSGDRPGTGFSEGPVPGLHAIAVSLDPIADVCVPLQWNVGSVVYKKALISARLPASSGGWGLTVIAFSIARIRDAGAREIAAYVKSWRRVRLLPHRRILRNLRSRGDIIDIGIVECARNPTVSVQRRIRLITGLPENRAVQSHHSVIFATKS